MHDLVMITPTFHTIDNKYHDAMARASNSLTPGLYLLTNDCDEALLAELDHYQC